MKKILYVIGFLLLVSTVAAGDLVIYDECTDTDEGWMGGDNIFEAGTSIGTGKYGTIESTDFCGFDPQYVWEFYCVDREDGYKAVHSKRAFCENGCINGACVPDCMPGDVERREVPTEKCSTDKCVCPSGFQERTCQVDYAWGDWECTDPDIPEFTTIGAGLALVGAGIGYAFVRKRK